MSPAFTAPPRGPLLLPRLLLSLFSLLACLLPRIHAEDTQAFSVPGAPALELTLTRPAGAPVSGDLPTVFYLVNLASPRRGTEGDGSIIRSFLEQGCQVVTVDFRSRPDARVPALNPELARLREALHSGRLLPAARIDHARSYLVPEGCRLLRDVVYYRDTEQDRVLGFDVIYPSKPATSVGAVLEFSCDNKDRMGNTSLVACSDTLLEGFASEGFAVVMADHPVKAPYKGLDPMPDCARKIKAALRQLRVSLAPLGHNGKVVPLGFSRGSGMALMLATTAGSAAFDGHGEVPSGRDDVQGGVIMSGRFTYMDLLPKDRMLSRYEKAWGPRDSSTEVWRRHGALDHWGKGELPPLFLTINCTEAPDALHQMKVLRQRLTERGAKAIFMLDEVPRGHKVTLVPEIIAAMNRYLHERLD